MEWEEMRGLNNLKRREEGERRKKKGKRARGRRRTKNGRWDKRYK